MPPSPTYRPSTRHADLGSAFYDTVRPAEFPQHILRYRNRRWAERVGLDGLSDDEWIAHFAKFEPLPGTFPQPLALRYHGHQFRTYNPEIGDGRGFLFAQLHDAQDGRLLDLGTKGSGRTPYSRTADGRLTLKGGVREILATEMLEALGVDTSKSFSLIETGEELVRGDEPSPTRSSVLVRLSHSHIRIGSFQRLRALGETDNVLRLLDHTVRTYMPEIRHDDTSQRAVAFLEEVCRRVARTGANWLAAGFVHGVLNSDNINVTGESFDYGPWRFLPANDPAFTAAYFDHSGLYSFGRQPEALFWNLTRLAECLVPFAQRRPNSKKRWACSSRPSTRPSPPPCSAASASQAAAKTPTRRWCAPSGISSPKPRRRSSRLSSIATAASRAPSASTPAPRATSTRPITSPPCALRWHIMRPHPARASTIPTSSVRRPAPC